MRVDYPLHLMNFLNEVLSIYDWKQSVDEGHLEEGIIIEDGFVIGFEIKALTSL